MNSNEVSILNMLITAYQKWDGDPTFLIDILEAQKKAPDFTNAVKAFKKYIHSPAGDHPNRYVKTHLFLDAYYIAERDEFKQLNKVIDSYLPQNEYSFFSEITAPLYSSYKYLINHPLQALTVLCSFTPFSLVNATPYSYLNCTMRNDTVTPTYTLFNEKIIRGFFDNTPGFGNQAATFLIINKFRRLGYAGKFEVIYPQSETSKIATLYGLPATLPDDFYQPDLKIRFMKWGYYANQTRFGKTEKIALGIAGSRFFPCDIPDVTKKIIFDMPNLCFNMANFANSEIFIQYTPYYRAPELSYVPYIQTAIQFFDKKEQKFLDSNYKFLTESVTDLPTIEFYLENNPKGQLIVEKKPALLTYLQAVKSHEYNILPVYGRTLCAKYSPNEFLNNILEIIMGARYAQQQGPLAYKKPLIIAVYYDYMKEAEILQNIINQDEWSGNYLLGMENVQNAIKKLALANEFEIGDLSSQNTIAQIKALKAGKILLLSMGSFSKEVFDALYAHTDSNIWPQVREGERSLDSLALTGKPHFRCGDTEDEDKERWDVGYRYMQDQKFKSKLEKFYSQFCSADSWANYHVYRQLGRLIIDASNPTSAFSHSFFQLKKEAAKPENDKVLQGLEEAEKYWRKQPRGR